MSSSLMLRYQPKAIGGLSGEPSRLTPSRTARVIWASLQFFRPVSCGVRLRATLLPQGPLKTNPPAPMLLAKSKRPSTMGVWHSTQWPSGPDK